jgi:hypothetical protein
MCFTSVERKRNLAKTCFTYVTPGNEKVFAFAKQICARRKELTINRKLDATGEIIRK